jgi:type VII secretion protein EccB
MASKRDLVEANSFNRRRLVTAFVSGAPGGREVDPQSPTRAVVAGVVLALLVVGGAALAGVLKPTLPGDWGDNSLVVGKDTGARYVALDERLYPVVNTVSARLMVEPGQFKVVFAPEGELADKPHGPTIGIVGAPDALPKEDALVQGPWASCLDERGRTRTTVSSQPGVRPAGGAAAVVVRVEGTRYVVTGGHRYRVEGDLDRTLFALGLDDLPVLDAPASWTDLFEEGSPFDAVDVPEAGDPVPSAWGLPAEAATLGSVLEVDDEDGEPRRYLLRERGRVLLTETAFEMYRVAVGDLAEPVRVAKSDLAGVPPADRPADRPYPGDWPAGLPRGLDDSSVCAHLHPGSGGAEGGPRAALATPRPSLPTGRPVEDPMPQQSAREVAVEPGAGAVVRTVSGNRSGTVFLVDSTGTRFALGGRQHSEDFVRRQLGYESVEPVTVPPSWLVALPTGPELSPTDANQTVTGSSGGGG